MIEFNQFTLSNGLHVIVHEDPYVQTAVVNLMYNVGSKNEVPDKTGFAHLFEHLMFGGSKNVKNFDAALQLVGGENNAFTSPDITNYYITLPSQNIETAFWLESDRMLSLSFDPNVLEVQRKVVIEEFKQRYLNQPYGDVQFLLREMAYQQHPYQWPTIGKEISHIEEATMDDVKAFFYSHYRPDNAVLVVGGNIHTDEVKKMAEKWFGPIPAGEEKHTEIPQEPEQQAKNSKKIVQDVPSSAFYKCYHTCGRNDEAYYATDIVSDILGSGKSSRLHQALVDKHQIFTTITASVNGSIDPGLLTISGRLHDHVTPEKAEEAVNEVINTFFTEGVSDDELFKVKNQAASGMLFSQVDLLERCVGLAYAHTLGDANKVNTDINLINKLTEDDLMTAAKKVLREHNANALYYEARS